jgi:HSP20 family protein
MALVRWEPAREVASLQTEMNRLLSTFFEPMAGGAGQGGGAAWVPPMDLVESADAFTLTADLPGVREADVTIEVDGDVLTISGERRSEHREDPDGYVRIERASGPFRRSVSLPAGIAPDDVAATFENGVLTVMIPKPASPTPHRVRIGGADDQATIEGSDAPPVPAGATA